MALSRFSSVTWSLRSKPFTGAAESMPGKAQTHEAGQKEDVLQTLAALSQAHSIEHASLDLSSIAGCGDICLETSLQVCQLMSIS